ncbi:uncharacterized protein SCHCODRAFT_02553901 [Schizophyllum commune H4-8]|nr:uncharacterized protein SCHCODRAFT_02553901 [Schizophyllum commune H4-8]KAI5886830.1 hypothetical protein SCHCODRAFT_02553901 [Schizophyllum commune H4-8]
MSLRQIPRRLSLEERLEHAASITNLAMLRTSSEPFHIQIQTIKWLTFLLESELRSLPPDDDFTRKKILAQLDTNRLILAPIRRLPLELLSYIFSLVVKKSPLRTVNIAAALSRICAAWRKVARAHPALWTTVYVENLNDFDEYRELFLPLTKDRPLELRCDDLEILEDLWDRMAPYAPRWRRITLGARHGRLPDLQVLHMESLERLVVFAYDAPISSELSVLDFVVAPRLCHIGLTLDVLQSKRQLHVPVARTLKSLMIETIEPFPITRVLPLLLECAATLRVLTLKIRDPLGGTEGSSPACASDILVMPVLTDLRVNDSACALLYHITTPLLEELVLSTVPAYGSHMLLQFLTRSQASHHLLDFRVYKTEERDASTWFPCVELMHSLRDLHFDELLSNEDFLERMVLHADKPPILPSLNKIAISNIYYRHIELRGLIREMCKSRSTMITIGGHRASLTLNWLAD